MMKQFNTRGFTLIELLVVIAIIGILASVVLASLNSARAKGSDAKVKAELNVIRSQAAIYYDDSGQVYTGFCADQRTVDAMTAATDAVSTAPVAGGFGDGECVESLDGSEWAAWVNLKVNPAEAFCVDYMGAADIIAVQDSSAVDLSTCP